MSVAAIAIQGRAAARERIVAAFARHGRRERLVLMLALVEHLRPVEIAQTLGISVRQVERTHDAVLDSLVRAARGDRPVRLRRAA